MKRMQENSKVFLRNLRVLQTLKLWTKILGKIGKRCIAGTYLPEIAVNLFLEYYIIIQRFLKFSDGSQIETPDYKNSEFHRVILTYCSRLHFKCYIV